MTKSVFGNCVDKKVVAIPPFPQKKAERMGHGSLQKERQCSGTGEPTAGSTSAEDTLCVILLGMRRLCLAVILLLAFEARLQAQRNDPDNAISPRCREYLKTPLPAEAAMVTAPKAWPDCDSYKLYTGIGNPMDFVAARKCAWSERLASQAGLEPRSTVASVFGGAPVLTVLYANGEGVDKNLPLALRLACEAGGAPAEVSTRLDHIESLATRIAIGDEKLNFCDDITSGFMEGFCAAYVSELADQKRARSLDAISARMSLVQRAAFVQLVDKEEAYSRAHGIGEIDLSGTARAMFQIDAEQTLRDDFLAALQSFEAGKTPAGSARA